MKKTIKALALLLCAVFLLSLASCVKDAPEDVPDGMKIATVAGADFRLYIPTSWNSNTAYGVSGGYFSLNTQSSVSMAKYPITEEMRERMAAAEIGDEGAARIEWFWNDTCKTALEKQSLGGSFSEVEAKSEDLINKVNAWRFHCKGIVNGKELHYLQVVAGYTPDPRPTPNIWQFAKKMESFGCEKAYALDGGQTGLIVVGGEVQNYLSYGSERVVSDIIYFATAIPDGG